MTRPRWMLLLAPFFALTLLLAGCGDDDDDDDVDIDVPDVENPVEEDDGGDEED